jgi:ribulose-phosphate 3-epimerase
MPTMFQKEITISPSLLSCDFGRIADETRMIEAAGADWLHVDVMDGHFVPNLTIGPPLVEAIHGVATTPLDVHLMISNPLEFAAPYADAGAHVLTFHAEVVNGTYGAREVIRAFRDAGVAQVGIALNPDTQVEAIGDVLDEVDLVLVMSVFPGFGGQKFMAEVLAKVEWLRARGYDKYIEMDGGLNAETLPLCAAAGADVLVSGSAIFNTEDRKQTIESFRALALEARAGAR